MEVKGKYNIAKVFTDNVDSGALDQVRDMCDNEIFKDSKLRFMPDIHKGKGVCIGTTISIANNKIIPNLVGVDIGCGMITVELDQKADKIDLRELDHLIKQVVPSGKNVREKEHRYINLTRIDGLRCKENVNIDRARRSLGTLGGGNHFIELGVGSDEKGLLSSTHRK